MDELYMWKCKSCKKLYEKGKEIEPKDTDAWYNYKVNCLVCGTIMSNNKITETIRYYTNETNLKSVDKEAQCTLCNRLFKREDNKNIDTKKLCVFSCDIPKRVYDELEGDFVIDIEYWCEECISVRTDVE